MIRLRCRDCKSGYTALAKEPGGDYALLGYGYSNTFAKRFMASRFAETPLISGVAAWEGVRAEKKEKECG